MEPRTLDSHVKLGWYFPKDVAEEFRAGAKKRGYNMSALIRIAMERYNQDWRKEDAEESAA